MKELTISSKSTTTLSSLDQTEITTAWLPKYWVQYLNFSVRIVFRHVRSPSAGNSSKVWRIYI